MKSFKQFITEEKEEIIIPKVHIWGALLSGDYGQIEAALRSPHHTEEHVDLGIGHRDSYVVTTALHSPHATKEQITDVIEKWSDKPFDYGGWLADEAQRELDRRNNESQQS